MKMTIETVRLQLAEAVKAQQAADFTESQVEAYKALWYAIDSLADLVDGR